MFTTPKSTGGNALFTTITCSHSTCWRTVILRNRCNLNDRVVYFSLVFVFLTSIVHIPAQILVMTAMIVCVAFHSRECWFGSACVKNESDLMRARLKFMGRTQCNVLSSQQVLDLHRRRRSQCHSPRSRVSWAHGLPTNVVWISCAPGVESQRCVLCL